MGFGELGMVYGVCAAGLGAWLLWGVLRVRSAAKLTQPAWSLYRSSLLYLALLFGAMLVDGFVPSRRLGPEPVQLRNPDISATALVGPAPTR